MEILSIIRGSSLPGLKAPKENQHSDKSGGTGKLSNLTTKWAKQNAVAAKICLNCNDLIYALASATLTQSLVQVAHPILSAMKVVQQGVKDGVGQHASTASFVLIDADSRTSIPVNKESDLLQSMGKTRTTGGVVNFLDSSDTTDNITTVGGNSSKHSSSSASASSLQKGEVMQTPQQLSQYHMMVTDITTLLFANSSLYNSPYSCSSVDNLQATVGRSAVLPEDAYAPEGRGVLLNLRLRRLPCAAISRE